MKLMFIITTALSVAQAWGPMDRVEPQDKDYGMEIQGYSSYWNKCAQKARSSDSGENRGRSCENFAVNLPRICKNDSPIKGDKFDPKLYDMSTERGEKALRLRNQIIEHHSTQAMQDYAVLMAQHCSERLIAAKFSCIAAWECGDEARTAARGRINLQPQDRFQAYVTGAQANLKNLEKSVKEMIEVWKKRGGDSNFVQSPQVATGRRD